VCFRNRAVGSLFLTLLNGDDREKAGAHRDCLGMTG
jgi:hypothetical protein